MQNGTVGALQRTRKETNAARVALSVLRRVPRVTNGEFDWDKVVAEVTARGLQLAPDAAAHFTSQTGSMSKRAVKVVRSKSVIFPRLHNILCGAVMTSELTPEQKAATITKRTATFKSRNLGQLHVFEAAAFKAFMAYTDPTGTVFESQGVLDGRAADVLIRTRGGNDEINNVWTGLQIKSATHTDHEVNFNLKACEGLSGGTYEFTPVLCLAFEEPDRAQARREAVLNYDYIPDVKLVYAIFYENASHMPLRNMYVRASTDLGDHRVRFDTDDIDKHTRFNDLFHTGIASAPRKFTAFEANFDCGPGSANPNIKLHSKLYQEVLNGRALWSLTDSLRAPLVQNQTTDIVWDMSPDHVIKISLKCASIEHGGKNNAYRFHTATYDSSAVVHCDIVMAFYRDEGGRRTHVSVICARRVYTKKSFGWSNTHNQDILRDRIAITEPGALQELRNAVLAVISADPRDSV